MTDFFKFPHTPHLAWLGEGEPRIDKALSPEERDAFLVGEIVVEEKVDGANVGLSVGPDGRLRARNRGAFIDSGAHPQFAPLWGWVAEREVLLIDALGSSLALFGEWCFAVHSVRYDRLPDFLLGFDIYDIVTRRFWSCERRDELLRHLAIPSVPRLAWGVFALSELQQILTQSSAFGSVSREGLYLRSEEDGWLKRRAKLVRKEFTQAISEHWSRRPLERNHLTVNSVGEDRML